MQKEKVKMIRSILQIKLLEKQLEQNQKLYSMKDERLRKLNEERNELDQLELDKIHVRVQNVRLSLTAESPA